MNQEQWRRVKDLFGAALHIPAERQVAFLEDTCDDDAEVRAEVFLKLKWIYQRFVLFQICLLGSRRI